MPDPLRFGREFLVNTTVHGPQQTPVIAGLENGGFAVVWDAYDTSAGAIHGQLFSSDGRAVGGEFQVNTTTARDQSDASVAGLADGRFVVSWRDTSATGGDTSVSAIRAQMYNVDGSPAGGEFLVNTRTDGFQNRPAVAALADGGFVIAWEDDSGRLLEAGDDVSRYAIRAQLFDREGGTIGGEFLVNTTTEDDQRGPAVTGLTGGRFVVSWSDLSETGGDTSAYAVRAQLFDSDGSPLGREILVNTATENWQQAPTVTGLAGGGFVISWTDDSQTGGDPFDSAVRAQVFSANGAMAGAEILVNTSVGGSQSDPTVAALAEGGFVVSWVDRWGTTIRAQVFDGEGAMVGGEFVVNTTTTGAQVQPSVAALADGRFVIGWSDYSATGGDTSMTAVRAQIFDPRQAPVTLNGTVLDDDFQGTRFGDRLSGFLGDDALSGNGGDDSLFGEGGNDVLAGGIGNDRLYGGAGDDLLIGDNGFDQLYGGDGSDRLRGGRGQDYMAGGAGDDSYVVEDAGDVVIERAGGGRDTVKSATISLSLSDYANIENLRLFGTADLNLAGDGGANVLVGNAGANRLRGGAGQDRLKGFAGDDILIGGRGRDVMFGGSGSDVFVFAGEADSGTTQATRDCIGDFSQGEGDLLDLSAIDASSAPGDQALRFLGTGGFTAREGELRFGMQGAHTIVEVDLDGDAIADFTLMLRGQVALAAGDFIL